jgi:hypothetical protein
MPERPLCRNLFIFCYCFIRIQLAVTRYRSDAQPRMTASRVFRHSSYPVVGKTIDPFDGGKLGDTACSIITIVHIKIFMHPEPTVPSVLVSCLL